MRDSLVLFKIPDRGTEDEVSFSHIRRYPPSRPRRSRERTRGAHSLSVIHLCWPNVCTRKVGGVVPQAWKINFGARNLMSVDRLGKDRVRTMSYPEVPADKPTFVACTGKLFEGESTLLPSQCCTGMVGYLDRLRISSTSD